MLRCVIPVFSLKSCRVRICLGRHRDEYIGSRTTTKLFFTPTLDIISQGFCLLRACLHTQGIQKIASFLNEFGTLTSRYLYYLCARLMCSSCVTSIRKTVSFTRVVLTLLGHPFCCAADLSTRFKLAKLNEKVTSLERSLDHIEAKVR